MANPLAERLPSVPTRPGVYLFKDAQGRTLYVGKARSLRARLRSYFQSPDDMPAKTRAMVALATDFEYIVTDTELEALLLEDTLVKKHKPRFNIRLRDDKHYPYIRVSMEEQYPRIYRVRQMRSDGGRYFGPFASSQSVNEALALVKRLFPYRSCTLDIRDEAEDPTHGRACLEYHIHRCLGPCIKVVNREEYRATVDQACLFLTGKQQAVVDELRAQMERAANDLQFERAARLRDQVQAVERIVERQKVVSASLVDQDVIGMARADSDACFQLFYVRDGKITGRDHTTIQDVAEMSDGELLAAFVQQFYADAPSFPPEVLLPAEPEDIELLSEWMRSSNKGLATLVVPKRGDKRKLVEMANENADEILKQAVARWQSNRTATRRAAVQLGTLLGLPRYPHRIECYDISNIQGTNPVGAMVVFIDGQPRNSEYRRFKIKSVQGSDDFSMLQEMLRRRFARALRGDAPHLSREHERAAAGEDEEAAAAASEAGSGEGDEDAEDAEGEARDRGWGAWPDLVIIDGGKGQVNAVAEVFDQLGVADVPLYGLAKQQEELFKPGESDPILLPRTDPALYLIQRIRDETHRFAVTFHRQLRGKRSLQSSLDSIAGVGPARRKALVRRFGSVQGVRQASEEELAAVPGITAALAHRIKAELSPTS